MKLSRKKKWNASSNLSIYLGNKKTLLLRRVLYSRRDLNPHDRNGHWILSPTCLPIPPLEHDWYGAKDGIWTRDPHLGKVMLYPWATFAWDAKLK